MRFPDDTDRLVIAGATGSGKTQAGLWHLSHRRFDLMPWVVYNFKRDRSIDAIPEARWIGLDEIPTAPGVYIAHPRRAEIRDGLLDWQLEKIWERGETGIFVDEGFMMLGQQNRSEIARDIMIQGRSLHIPVIVNTQRPKWLDAFVFTEANFWQIFRLQWEKDRDAVREFVPSDSIGERLPRYHSHYYDVGENELTPLRPVPSMETIHATFARRLGRRRA